MPTLGMDIEFYDVPGGHTQDMDQWVEQKILPDLQTANGVHFFISAEDAWHNPNKLLKDNMVFEKAIDSLRKNPEGRRWRQDVPIYFLFTKCDGIPAEVTVDELEARIPGLVKAAKNTGKHVRSWKVTSLGKWDNPTTPPKEYQPIHVLESMEHMLDDIKKSVHKWKRKMAIVVSVVTLLGWGGSMYVASGIESSRWYAARSTIEKHMEREEFQEALDAMQEFYDRYKFPALILPAFMVEAPDEATLKHQLYTQREGQLYKGLEPYLSVDVSVPPKGNKVVFCEGAKRLEEYLGFTEFNQIAEEHYAKAQFLEPYYEAGSLLLCTSEDESVKDDFVRLKDQLDLVAKLPETWRDALGQKTDALLRKWLGMLPLQDATVPQLEENISNIELLLGHSMMPQELRAVLEQKKDAIRSSIENMWNEETASVVNEANDKTPEEALQMLEKAGSEAGLPSACAEQIEAALSLHYTRLVDALLKDNPDVDVLRDALVRYSDMDDVQRERVEKRIATIFEEEIKKTVVKIDSANNLEGLKTLIPTLQQGKEKYPMGASALSQKFQDAASRIINRETGLHSDEAGKKISTNDFGGAKEYVEQQLEALIAQVRFGGRAPRCSGHYPGLEDVKKEQIDIS